MSKYQYGITLFTFIVSAENNETGRYMYFEVRDCPDAYQAVQTVYDIGGFSCGEIEVRSEWPDDAWRKIVRNAEILRCR